MPSREQRAKGTQNAISSREGKADVICYSASISACERPGSFTVNTWGTTQLSYEKNLGWLGYTGDYTTQLYGDYNKPL